MVGNNGKKNVYFTVILKKPSKEFVLTLAKPNHCATMASGMAGNKMESFVPNVTSCKFIKNFLRREH